MAAALSIPLTLDGGPFPDRDLVLFATFCVITVTLVGLGGALSRVVHWLGVGRAGAEEAASDKRDERAVRLEGIDAVLAAIDRAAQDGESPIAVAALHRTTRRPSAASGRDRGRERPTIRRRRKRAAAALLDVERESIRARAADNRLRRSAAVSSDS
jgi:CPA1 family monovalent cation:H+ antiporter